MASLFISAAHKSSGKTTISIGLNAVLRRRGLCVQPFKKGPDYIDPIWLSMAAGRSCYNLDFYTAGKEETIQDYLRRSEGVDISIIEGNKGLYDGLDLDGSNSNAALASALQTPVILVVDARGTMRGIAPLLIGYQVFDREVNIAGVIANMTGGARHESKLRAAVEHYTDIPFLGAIGNDDSICLTEKHIGLIPGYEDPESRAKISTIADAVNHHIDVDRIIDIAGTAPKIDTKPSTPVQVSTHTGLKIGIAQDSAFGFYYPGDLEAIQATGANPLQVFVYAVLPQVKVAWTGISIYTWDAAFRAATVVGFFGAGGMGWYLRRTVQQIESTRVAAILFSIIALVVISEVSSAWARIRVGARMG